MDYYNDLIGINEDWYDDEARKNLKWDTSDTAMVGIGAAQGAVDGYRSDNMSTGQGAAAGAVGSVLGVYTAKGIIYLCYKAKSHRRGSKRARNFQKDHISKDYTNSLFDFMKSPVKGASEVKKDRENGSIEICIKNSKKSYLMTYDNSVKSFVIDIYEDGKLTANITPKNKNDAKRIISQNIAPYVIEEDLDEYFEKGYGYCLTIKGCPESTFSKELAKISDSIKKQRNFKEETEASYYNDLL